MSAHYNEINEWCIVLNSLKGANDFLKPAVFLLIFFFLLDFVTQLISTVSENLQYNIANC